MKRFQLVVIISMITAGAIWLAFYRSRHTSSAAVTALLPKETLAFVHMPDFNRARAEFHQTDLYQLWTEPALQDFLQKPRAKIPTKEDFRITLQECEALQLRDAFIAVVTIESSAWKVIGGFRFKGDSESAEKIVAKWKAKLVGNALDSKQETINYQGHQIQADIAGMFRLSTARDGQWFLIANDLDQLKSFLDRVDGRVKDRNNTLAADDVFGAAAKRMPSIYLALAFAHIDRFVEKLMPLADTDKNDSGDQLAAIRQIRSLCTSISFDGGKIRDTIFVGMPKLLEVGSLTRAALPIATKDAFLYATGFLNLTKPLPLPGSQGPLGWLAGVQKITAVLSSKGITLESWNSAFGPELSWIGEWPANSHWPSLFFTLPVKDSPKANKILSIITTSNEASALWTHHEKNGAQYFSTLSGGPFLSLSPTIGLSDRMLVAGADEASVEAAMKRSTNGNSELATSKKFLSAESAVPPATQALIYIDPALIYTRVDATLRPMLLWSAAFLPGIADTIDLSKLPSSEVITKHLSPIVMSQRYDEEGYVAESVGPITLGQTIAGLGGLGGLAAMFYQDQTRRRTQAAVSPPVIPAIAPGTSPSLSPSPTPEASPE